MGSAVEFHEDCEEPTARVRLTVDHVTYNVGTVDSLDYNLRNCLPSHRDALLDVRRKLYPKAPTAGRDVNALSAEMRRALATMRGGSLQGRFLGPGAGEVPRGTAKALIDRGLAYMDGSRIKLTYAGQDAADHVAEAHRKLLHGDS